MGAMVGRFQYEPLGADEIRVVGFEREGGSGTSSTISLKLHHIKRPSAEPENPESAVAYHALSYAWGNGKQECLIHIDKAKFYISAGLHDALYHFRSDESFGSESFLLWIDAICIDQSNNNEKTTQVLRMRDTYRDACKVVVWLGHHHERREATGRTALFLSSHLTPIPDGLTSFAAQPDYLRDPRNAAVMDTLGQDIMRRPWWWRVWVIQEVAFARSLVVICDGHHFNWGHLVYMARLGLLFRLEVTNAAPRDIAEGNPFFPNILFKSKYRHKLVFSHEVVDLPILELLEDASSCLATNPRDMIYSLMGLATDIESSDVPNDEHKLVVSYERSVQEVYIDFARVHICTHAKNPLNVITFSRYNPKRMENLPSWVPDWSNLRGSACFSLADPGTLATYRNRYRYHASGTRRAEFRFIADNALRVSGICFNNIAEVGEPYSEEGMPDEEEFWRIIRAWETLALHGGGRRERDPYLRGTQTLSDVFDRTITADTTLTGERAPLNKGLFFLGSCVFNSYVMAGRQAAEERVELESELDRVGRAVQLRIRRRRFFITSKGLFGLGPMNAEVGDTVFILYGCSVPVVLRRNGDRWSFVGEAFVAGIMDGEVVQVAEQEGSGDGEEDERSSLLKGNEVVIEII